MESLGGGSAAGFMDAPNLALASTSEAYPCDGVDEQYRAGCFKYLPAFAQARFRSENLTDRTEMVRRETVACERFRGIDRMRCLYGIGLNVSGRIFQNNPEEIPGLCDRFSSSDERKACTIGLVTNWVQFNRGSDALSLCAGITEAERRHVCYVNAFEHMTHKSGAAYIAALCEGTFIRATCMPEYEMYRSNPSAAVAPQKTLLGPGLW